MIFHGDRPEPGSSSRSRADHDAALAESLSDALEGGERDALSGLVEAHADALFEFVLYRVGRRREVAEDLTQDTLVTALTKIAEFDGRSSLRTWIFGIAKNKVRESIRARRARSLGDILVDADDELLATLNRIDEEPLPDEVLERDETRALVGATLSSLPESYRTALTERYVDGLSLPETARRQGRGVKAAESTLHRAKKAFVDVFTVVTKHAFEAVSDRGDHAPTQPGKTPAGGRG